MMHLVLIGIGTGNPEHMTVQGIRALNAADLVLVPRKGAEKDDLAGLRREICARYLENAATRVVEFDLPVRDGAGPYRAGVEDWHRAIAATYRVLLARHAGPGSRVALLIWGDPSLYDSTLRILGHLADMGLAFEHSVVPGITSLQALAAGHRVALNEVGGEVRIVTGRQLGERGAPEGDATLLVVLDGDCAFRGLRGEEWEICWGAYLGMPQEILIAGPLAEVGARIVAARAAARAAHGWIMDTYLLRRR
ncbi:MAG TPA: precorrin-6A synthase (deacetylating) [Amaricoccus sp.]|nr:precorrin-6A synthase (deacetylating) [Amaricoccus sp.]